MILISILLAVTCYFLRSLDRDLIEYGEGPILAMVARMQREPIAPEWRAHLPLTLSCYGPAYYRTVALVDRFDPLGPSVVVGRFINLLAALGTAALIYLMTLRLTAIRVQAAAGALLFLVSPVVCYWLPAYRVDMLAVLCSCGAFMAVAGGLSLRRLVLCGLLVALGSLFKQVAALSALPIWLWLLANRQWRKAAVFAGLVSAFGLAFWGLADLATDGSALGPAVKSNLNRMRLENGLGLFFDFVRYPSSLLSLAAAGWLLRPRTRNWQQPASLFALALLTSVGVNVLLSCKEGAALNYFLEASMLGSIVLTLAVVPASEDLSQPRVRRAWLAIGLVLVAPALALLAFDHGGFGIRNANSSVVQASLIAGEHTTVLADSEWIDAVLRQGAMPAVNDSFLLSMADRQGSPAVQQLIDEMHRGQIEFVLLANPTEYYRQRETTRWPSSVVEAMQRDYEPVSSDQHAYLYRHRSAVANRARGDGSASAARGSGGHGTTIR
ncbi:MAG TPA: glycosyltransferase family 39 protein [Pirellulales bacterium]